MVIVLLFKSCAKLRKNGQKKKCGNVFFIIERTKTLSKRGRILTIPAPGSLRLWVFLGFSPFEKGFFLWQFHEMEVSLHRETIIH